MAIPVLDVVIPVHNEQATLAACVHRLDSHLRQTFPYPFRITVADNASTDGTWAIASQLSSTNPRVSAIHLTQQGRGRALKATWSASDAHIVAYMDVDLSTDLDALWPLVAPLMSGHSDLAIGSRLTNGSRVVRGAKREIISRCYNLMLKGALGARFSDAQCGFKAIRADVAAQILPHVQDHAWFFDTELLAVAERCGLRVHEVAVDWYDDPDSRVDVVRTATDDLRGVMRVRRALTDGTVPVLTIAEQIGRGPMRRRGLTGAGQATRFAGIGAVTSGVHLALFATLTSLGVGLQSANAAALVLATLVNTAANRRWTFGLRGRETVLPHHIQGLALLLLGLGVTSAALGILHLLMPQASTGTATLVLVGANLIATAVKFVAFRRQMARPGPQPMVAGPGAGATPSPLSSTVPSPRSFPEPSTNRRPQELNALPTDILVG